MVALVFCGDLKYCPYIKRYIERLELHEVKYSVYFWNRGGFNLDLPTNYHYYDTSSDLSKGKLGKLFDFINFRKWLFTKLNSDKPEKIVALSTLTGVIMGKKLYSKKTPYVFDIRDYSYEHIAPFAYIENKVIESSFFTAISSKGFKSFLPERDYVIAHNFNRNDITGSKNFKRQEGKISFVWNGVVRYFEFQKQYLDALKNDSRFEIVFHGDGPELDLYKEYCKKEGFTNIIFTGSYNNDQKEELLRNAGILNNCYGYTQNAGNKLKYAVSNRFYDGMIYHIPQLVETEGFKPEWAKETGIGISIPADIGFADKLYDYYKNIGSKEFDEACNKALEQVIKEDDKYTQRIDSFILV